MSPTIPTEGLLIRSAPDPAKEPLTRLEGGQAVTVMEHRGVWAQVETADGLVGWVDGRRVVTGSAASGRDATPRREVITMSPTIPTEGLLIRSAPDPAEESLTRLEGGQAVTVMEHRGVWAQVETADGLVGWVDGRRLVTGSAASGRDVDHGLFEHSPEEKTAGDEKPPRLGTALVGLVFGLALLTFVVIMVAPLFVDDNCSLRGLAIYCRGRNYESWTGLLFLGVVGFLGLGLTVFGAAAVFTGLRSVTGRRFVAWVYDAAIVALPAVAAASVSSAPLPALLAMIGVAYALWGNVFGQTAGRILLGIAVIRIDAVTGPDAVKLERRPEATQLSLDTVRDARPGWAKGLTRTIVGSLSIFYGFAHLWALWDKEERTLGDRVAGTRVVRIAPTLGR